jgi:hypothetical protein
MFAVVIVSVAMMIDENDNENGDETGTKGGGGFMYGERHAWRRLSLTKRCYGET